MSMAQTVSTPVTPSQPEECEAPVVFFQGPRKASPAQDMCGIQSAPMHLDAALEAMERRLVEKQSSLHQMLSDSVALALRESVGQVLECKKVLRELAERHAASAGTGKHQERSACLEDSGRGGGSERELLLQVLTELQELKAQWGDGAYEYPTKKLLPPAARGDPGDASTSESEERSPKRSTDRDRLRDTEQEQKDGLDGMDLGSEVESSQPMEEDLSDLKEPPVSRLERAQAAAKRCVRDILGEAPEGSYFLRLSQNKWFTRFSGLVTAATCILIAVDTDTATRKALQAAVGGGTPTESAIDDWAASEGLQRGFLGWLALEIIVNLLGLRSAFFLGRDWHWNILDLMILVATSVATMTTGVAVSFTRALRIARVSRSFRAVRFIRYSESLQRMMSAFSSVALCLIWVGVLMAIVFFIVGTAMMEGVTTFLEEKVIGRDTTNWRAPSSPMGPIGHDAADFLQALQTCYGNALRTGLTLFRAISGSDWSALAAPLAATHPFWAAAWPLYVFIMVFGILNVLVGLVVDIVRRPPQDRELWLAAEAQDERAIAAIFAAELAPNEVMPAARTTISSDMVKRLLRRPTVSRKLRHFGIETEQLGDVFHAMADQPGPIAIKAVARFFLSLRGDAQSKDLTRLMSEVVVLTQEQRTMLVAVQDMSRLLKESIVNEPGVALM